MVTPIDLFKQDARFNKKNIKIVDVCPAGHFPWIEQPELVKEKMLQFSSYLASMQYEENYIQSNGGNFNETS